MKVCAILFVLLVSGLSVLPQVSPTPVPTPQATPVPTPPPTQQLSGMDRMRMRRESQVNLTPAEQARYQNLLATRYVAPLYRKPTKEELISVAIDPSSSARYSSFLDLPKTGIFKLIRDLGCDEKASVVSAADECVKYSMPGAGNVFSFRTGSYRLRRLGDISFRGESFFAPGVFMHGILVDLGNAEPGRLSLDSPGVRALAEFRAAATTVEATKIGERIARGFEIDGLRYSGVAALKANTTYAMRSIAYRGKIMRAVEGLTYNEMDHDKRRDVVVVFRVVEIDADGSATIVWRELRNEASPELKNEK